MSWSTGETILCETWEKVRDHIDEREQVEVLVELIALFEDYDMDSHSGIYDLEGGEEAMRELHPDWEHIQQSILTNV